MSEARDARGPRAADRRKAKLDEMRLGWASHWSEAERLAYVARGEWPAWNRRSERKYSGEYYEP